TTGTQMYNPSTGYTGQPIGTPYPGNRSAAGPYSTTGAGSGFGASSGVVPGVGPNGTGSYTPSGAMSPNYATGGPIAPSAAGLGDPGLTPPAAPGAVGPTYPPSGGSASGGGYRPY